MSLATKVADLAVRIGTEFKTIRTELTGKLDVSAYTGADVLAKIKTVDGSGSGLDADTLDGHHAADFATADDITTAVNGLVNGAPGALDTLKELATALGDDAAFSATVSTPLGNRVRFDAAQTLSAGQKTQALSNIGAVAANDLGDAATNFVTTFEAALV